MIPGVGIFHLKKKKIIVHKYIVKFWDLLPQNAEATTNLDLKEAASSTLYLVLPVVEEVSFEYSCFWGNEQKLVIALLLVGFKQTSGWSVWEQNIGFRQGFGFFSVVLRTNNLNLFSKER